MYGIKVPDDSTVTFCREIKFKMGFVVVHCCYYDKISATHKWYGQPQITTGHRDWYTVMEAGAK